MKRILFTLVALLPFLALAQGFNGDTGCDCFSNKKKGDKIPFYLGLDGGYFLQPYTSPSENTKTTIGSPYGGVIVGAHVAKVLSVQTGVKYTYANNVDIYDPDINPLVPIDNAKVSMQYLEIPIELQLRLIVYRNFTIYLQTGFYNNLVMKRDYVSDFSSSSESRIYFNRMYLGGGLGFGLIFNRNWMVFAIPEYHVGLKTDEAIQPDFSKRFGARAGVTYTIRKKK